MTRTRRGIDRIKVASLRGNVARTEETLRAHKIICADCSQHENSAKYACEAGWSMLKEVSRAANFLNSYLGIMAGKQEEGQGELF